MIKFYLKLNFKYTEEQKYSIIKLCKENIKSDKRVELSLNINNRFIMILTFVSDNRIIFISIIDRRNNSVNEAYQFNEDDFIDTINRLSFNLKSVYDEQIKLNDEYYHDILKEYFENYEGDTDVEEIEIDLGDNGNE